MSDCPVCHQEICLCGEVWHQSRIDGTAQFKIPWYRYAWARFRLWLSETR